jgi:hypothetical protein
MRFTIPLGEKTSFAFSLEQASSDVSFSTPTFASLPNSPTPDGAISFRHESTRGHIAVATLMRSPAAYLPDGRSDSVFGWGFNLSGAIKVFGRDTIVYQGAYGAGMERYVNDTSGLGIDAAPANARAPHLKALPVIAPYGAYQHYWTKQLRSSAVYGFTQVQNSDLEPGSTYHQANYGAANLIWNPIGSLNVGAEYLYGWKVLKDRSSANASRFMFSAKYNFVKSTLTK